jgi:hypothetical protein
MPLPPDPRTTYDPTDPAEDAPLARKHRLVRETKRLVEAVAHLDADEAAPDDISALTDAVRHVADRVAAGPSLHARGGLAGVGGHQGALLERSGISGRSNPLAAPVQWHEDGRDVLNGWAAYSPAYEGPLGHVHGGFVAAAFDDLLGCAQMKSGKAGYTGTLTVRMMRPTPLGRRIDYAAGVERVDGRKIHVWGTSECDGERLGQAEIVFVAPKTGMPR